MSTQFFTEANQYAILVEDVGPCRKKLTIEVNAEHVSAMLQDSMSEAAGQASLPGFRPGKAPKKLIERRFGASIREETKEKLVSAGYKQALEEHKLRVVGDPEGGEGLREMELEAGQALTFTIEVEVVPEFVLPALGDVKVKRPQIEVSDEEVQQQVETLAANEGELQSKEQAEAGDYLVGHGVLRIEGKDEAVHDIEGSVVQIPEDGGKGMILGVMVEDFGKQVGTPKVGSTVTIKAAGPEQHEVEEIRGKSLAISFEIKEINAVVPAKVEVLVQAMGASDEDAMHEMIRGRLEQQIRNKQQHAMRQQVAKHLLGSIEFELPEKLTSQQSLRNLQRKQLDMQYQGVEANEIESHLAELRSSSDEAAQRELKLFFILDQVANEQNLQISEQEINGFIVQLAMSRGMRPDVVRQELLDSGRIQQVARQIREYKALDSLLSQTVVEDVPIEDYNEFVEGTKGSESGEKAEKPKPAASKKKTTTKKTTTKKTTAKKKTTKKKTTKKSDD